MALVEKRKKTLHISKQWNQIKIRTQKRGEKGTRTGPSHPVCQPWALYPYRDKRKKKVVTQSILSYEHDTIITKQGIADRFALSTLSGTTFQTSESSSPFTLENRCSAKLGERWRKKWIFYRTIGMFDQRQSQISIHSTYTRPGPLKETANTEGILLCNSSATA